MDTLHMDGNVLSLMEMVLPSESSRQTETLDTMLACN